MDHPRAEGGAFEQEGFTFLDPLKYKFFNLVI